MSLLSALLGARVVDDLPVAVCEADGAADAGGREGCAPTGLRTLADLRPGESATIASVCAGTDPASARRIFDLGFAPGSPVVVLRRAPLADPMVFRVAGYDIAMRRAQARCITVTAAP